jgi:hypothetical protein
MIRRACRRRHQAFLLLDGSAQASRQRISCSPSIVFSFAARGSRLLRAQIFTRRKSARAIGLPPLTLRGVPVRAAQTCFPCRRSHLQRPACRRQPLPSGRGAAVGGFYFVAPQLERHVSREQRNLGCVPAVARPTGTAFFSFPPAGPFSPLLPCLPAGALHTTRAAPGAPGPGARAPRRRAALTG